MVTKENIFCLYFAAVSQVFCAPASKYVTFERKFSFEFKENSVFFVVDIIHGHRLTVLPVVSFQRLMIFAL